MRGGGKATPGLPKGGARAGHHGSRSLDDRPVVGRQLRHRRPRICLRLARTLTWARSEPGDNGYAHPVEGILAWVDLNKMEVVHLEDTGNVPVHGDPGGVFIATREASNGTQRCAGRHPLLPMMEPADLWKRQDLSGAAGLNGVRLGVEATDLIRDADRKPAHEILDSRLRHKAGHR